MPAVPSTPRVKLRATSRRVPRSRAATVEAEIDVEPNMRLSRAILVMLLLHVVAVGGILAFSLIKEQNADKNARNTGTGPGGALEAEDSLLAPTKPAAPSETPSQSGKSSIHVVQPGETLLRIANDSGVTVDALIAANGARTAMSSLHPGQELKLPEKSPDPMSVVSDRAISAADRAEESHGNVGGASSPVASTLKLGRLPPDSGKIYTVGKGESPYVIAQKLKVSYESLLKLNHIEDPKKLKPGQKLRIPAPASSKS